MSDCFTFLSQICSDTQPGSENHASTSLNLANKIETGSTICPESSDSSRNSSKESKSTTSTSSACTGACSASSSSSSSSNNTNSNSNCILGPVSALDIVPNYNDTVPMNPTIEVSMSAVNQTMSVVPEHDVLSSSLRIRGSSSSPGLLSAPIHISAAALAPKMKNDGHGSCNIHDHNYSTTTLTASGKDNIAVGLQTPCIPNFPGHRRCVWPEGISKEQDHSDAVLRAEIANSVIDDFDLTKTLGTGSFSRIRLAITRGKSKNRILPFAMKILRKSDILQLQQEAHTYSERNVLVALRGHPFIVTFYKTYQNTRCLFMLLEYVPGGEVFSILRRMGKFTKEMAHFYTTQLVLAFQYMHQFKIAYRDTKPENFLIDELGYLRVVDFGFAKECQTKTLTLCGTPEYLAPEILLSTGHDVSVDWWSLGIFIYEMLVGQPPFQGETLNEMYRMILGGQVQYWPDDIVQFERDVINGLILLDPVVRLENGKSIQEQNYFMETPWDMILRKDLDAPYVPELDGPTDTRHYEQYPDSIEHPDEVVVPEDAFRDFEITVK